MQHACQLGKNKGGIVMDKSIIGPMLVLLTIITLMVR